MRLIPWVSCVALLVVAGKDGHAGDPARPDPGALDSVVAQSARDGKPLIVEFYTEWCAPCKVFDARVLPDPKVQAELANVRFVRYDAERGSGVAAAEKLRINSYPSFLALDDKGDVRMKRSGIDPEDPRWFVEFLQRGALAVQTEERVLAARKRAPGDARLADATGRWYVEHDRPADALAHLDAAVAADKNNAQGIAAEAAWTAGGIRRGYELRARFAKDLLSYVRAYPGGKHAVEALTLASVEGSLPPAERRTLWLAVVDAHKASAGALNDMVYSALAAGEFDGALVAAKRQVELTHSANSHDSLAEVHHYRREKTEALAREDEGLALLKPDDTEASAMRENRARFAADPFVPDAGVTATRQRALDLWKQLGALDRPAAAPDAMSDMMAAMMAYRGARSATLSDAGKLCAAQAGKLTEAYVRIDLGGAEPAVTVLEPDAPAPLKRCLVDKLRKASYPKRPAGVPAKAVDRVPLKDPPPGMH